MIKLDSRPTSLSHTATGTSDGSTFLTPGPFSLAHPCLALPPELLFEYPGSRARIVCSHSVIYAVYSA